MFATTHSTASKFGYFFCAHYFAAQADYLFNPFYIPLSVTPLFSKRDFEKNLARKWTKTAR